MTKTNVRPPVAIALLAVLSCSPEREPTGSVALRLSETYVLRTIAGEAVPAVFTDHEFSTQRIVADTLVLAGGGTGREVQVLAVLDKTTGELATHTDTLDLTFTVDDGRIEIAYECNDVIIVFASCIAPPHLAGDVASTGIVFDFALGRTPLAFERIDR